MKDLQLPGASCQVKAEVTSSWGPPPELHPRDQLSQALVPSLPAVCPAWSARVPLTTGGSSGGKPAALKADVTATMQASARESTD